MKLAIYGKYVTISTIPLLNYPKMGKSLSTYLPDETHYYYGYPAGTGSGFVNTLPPCYEELLSARPLSCAGNLKIVCLANGVKKDALSILSEEVGLPLAAENQVIRLPTAIDTMVTGCERNRMVQAALQTLVPDGNFLMAQPYEGTMLDAKYLIPRTVTYPLNDKGTLEKLVPPEYLLETFASFPNGAAFAACEGNTLPMPCVVKVTSASAGDGVRICKNLEDFTAAQKEFAKVSTPIIVQEYLGGATEVGVQFGVPRSAEAEADILGFSTQIIAPTGKYLGGNFNDNTHNEIIDRIYDVIRNKILPKVRERGWYGVGGLDVMIRPDGSFVFIDGNFRMTATHVYRFNVENGLVSKPFVTMTASMPGNLETFRRSVVPLASRANASRIFHPVSLSECEGMLHFNGGLLYDTQEDLVENARHALSLGVRSKVLESLVV